MMYLNKLKIQGFKSFANKNSLVFSGLISEQKRGLTTIVGPNGSGKSNVADAIRWGLGEQSIKTLRGKKSEDIIFSGSDRKSRLSFAEVSLFLSNTPKNSSNKETNKTIEKESDIDQIIKTCSEIVITRHLFRNGDSEYLLNNTRVRLSDIQLLLAKANFGQKTYSVIGQGMVENFLNTSISERKDFFDEATGVKQFQIKRDSSLNKLENSYENLQQIEMLLNEIKPRLRSLTRQVEKLNKRSQLEKKLQENQLNYYHQIWKQIDDRLNQYNSQYLEQDELKRTQEKEFNALNNELEKLKHTDNHEEINTIKDRLQLLYNSKNQLHKELAKIQAELEIDLESRGQFDLSWLSNKASELKTKLEDITIQLHTNFQDNGSQHNLIDQEIKELTAKTKKKQIKLQRIKNEIEASSTTKINKTKLKIVIDDFLESLNGIQNEDNIEKIKLTITEAKDKFNNNIKTYFINDYSQQLQDIDKLQSKIISLNEKKQRLSNELNSYRMKASAENEHLKTLRAKREELQADLQSIEEKLTKITSQDKSRSKHEKNKLELQLNDIIQEIQIYEEQLAEINRNRESEKLNIFNYQNKIQNLQNKVNQTNTILNDLKINITRQETRLEDLEANIRDDELNIIDIQKHSSNETIDLENIKNKINSLKTQLELIGGIDPETSKEYTETKERFDFLNKQTKDLNETIKSLEEIIQKLDITIKNKFDKEFKVISEKFNEYFKILFSGGQAKISRIPIEDSSTEDAKENKNNLNDGLKKIKFLKKHNSVGIAGIDIQATPPGKKIQIVTMLSGGERALTAIALICAIISANPSPFVVLDEVDASLDESNSERFAKILDDLSNKTQFIVITHNRASMKKASILYGVTMGNDGVSKLLSIKLKTSDQENK